MTFEINKLLRDVESSDISSIRPSLNGVMEIVNDPNSSAYDLKEAIETDPPLAARVLRRANSSYYGISRKGKGVADIQMAVVCLGFETIKELALSQSVSRVFGSKDVVHGYSRAALWEHCVATALAGKLIFRREFKMPSGHVYAAGLLHDIGIVVEDQGARDAFHQVMKAFSESPELGLYAHERHVFGFSHAEVGGALAARWSFPAALCQAIGSEKLPEKEKFGANDLVAATVRLASWATQRRRLGFVESPQLDESRVEDAMKRLNVSPLGLDLIMAEVETELERMKNDGWC